MASKNYQGIYQHQHRAHTLRSEPPLGLSSKRTQVGRSVTRTSNPEGLDPAGA